MPFTSSLSWMFGCTFEVTHFLILSAGMAINQNPKEEKPPDRNVAVPVFSYKRAMNRNGMRNREDVRTAKDVLSSLENPLIRI